MLKTSSLWQYSMTYWVEKLAKVFYSSQDMGFGASLPSKKNFDPQLQHREEIRKWFHSFLWSLIFGVPCMTIMMIFMTRHSSGIHDQDLIKGLSLENLLLFLTSTPVLVSLFCWVLILFRFNYIKIKLNVNLNQKFNEFNLIFLS